MKRARRKFDMTLPARTRNTVLIVVLAFCGLGPSAVAQMNVQILSEGHTAFDGQALIRVRNLQDMQERWQTTHSGGEASFSGLAWGTYSVEVSAVGFRTAQQDVELRANMQLVQVVLQRDVDRTPYAPPATTGISRKAREASERGILALQAGNLKEAEKSLRKALKEAPQHAHVNYLLAVVLLQKKQGAEAQKFLEKSIALDPMHAQALTTLGGLRLEQKDYPSATHLLQRAIAVNDRQWRAHWLLANVFLAQRKYEQARFEGELAVSLSNHSAPYASLVLGEALNELGRHAEAVTSLRDFLKRAPTSPDAPAVQRMLSWAESRSRTETEPMQPPPPNLAALPLRNASLISSVSAAWGPPDVDSVLLPVAAGATCPGPRVLEGAADSVKELVDALDRFSAVRTQIHERVNLLGNPTSRESRKSDYLVAIAQPEPGTLRVSEYSRDLSGLGAFNDGFRTQGMLALALIFHPDMQDGFDMNCEGLSEWKGEPTWLVHFRQRPDRLPRLQNFKFGGQTFSIALKGRAWITASAFRIVHVEADLVTPIPEIELRTEHQIADYGPVEFKKKGTQMWLPKDTWTYFDFRGQRYRFSDHFDDFTLFSVESPRDIRASSAGPN